jgi:glycosyl transferase family 1/glycosyl transferase family 4
LKRVAFVHASADLYGSDRVLLEHLLCLDRSRYEVQVYLPALGPLTTRLSQAGIAWELADVVGLTRPERTLRGVWRGLRAARGWAQRLERAEVDLVHTSTLACLGGALGARSLGIPHLWHVQEIPPPPAQRALAPLLRAAGGLRVANSQAVARWLSERGLSSRVVYPGRRAAASIGGRGELRAALGIPADACCALLLGRLSPRKGQRLALEAFERAQGSSLYLLIAGDKTPGHSGYRRQLRDWIARSGSWDRIRLLEGCAEPWSLLAASDLALVPSVEPESFGLVALEALASGRPVLATDTGGLREVLGSAGELLPSEPAAWARAWERMAERPELRAERAAAGLQQAARFTPERASAALVGLYEELLP